MQFCYVGKAWSSHVKPTLQSNMSNYNQIPIVQFVNYVFKIIITIIKLNGTDSVTYGCTLMYFLSNAKRCWPSVMCSETIYFFLHLSNSKIYRRTLKTQHLDSSFNICLKRRKRDHFGCMLKSVHL